MAKELVFNPVEYAKVCAKQDAEGYKRGNSKVHGIATKDGKRAYEHNSFGCYYDDSKGFGKLWEGVRDWRKSCEW